MRELFFYILNGATARIVGAIKRIGSAPGEKYSLLVAKLVVNGKSLLLRKKRKSKSSSTYLDI